MRERDECPDEDEALARSGTHAFAFTVPFSKVVENVPEEPEVVLSHYQMTGDHNKSTSKNEVQVRLQRLAIRNRKDKQAAASPKGRRAEWGMQEAAENRQVTKRDRKPVTDAKQRERMCRFWECCKSLSCHTSSGRGCVFSRSRLKVGNAERNPQYVMLMEENAVFRIQEDTIE